MLVGKDKERSINLKESEIEEIIMCLKDVPSSIFTFMNYEKIIDKLRKEKHAKKNRSNT